ncbi:MAG TPA: hypothetical protein VK939_12325, partial [Longimicrobiales bacterium]|nr:hypothetical protein [Longimicrobiales bacterium]
MGSRVHGALVSACLLCLNLSAVAPLAGQRSTFPERPRLAASADTNDAAAYYRFGKEQLRRTPKLAAQAFYWATRLDPTSAEAFYARRIGILLEEPNLVLGYLDREKHAMRSRAARTADSLYQRALMMEPFLVRTLDRALWDGYGEQWAREVERSTRLNDPGALRYDIDRFLKQASPELRALYSYTEGNYPDAVRNYGIALQRRRYKGWLYAQRAHVQFVSGHLAEAESDLGLAMQEARKADEKDVVYFYESKANYEFALGYIMEASGRTSEALEAYG